jgi:hypothetical protein
MLQTVQTAALIAAGAFLLALVGLTALKMSHHQTAPQAERGLSQQLQSGDTNEPADHSKGEKESTDAALARYTYWLMAFTGLLALATIALAVATVGLWNYAAEQARDMKASIIEARRSATAANLAADIAQRTLIASQRAWISMKAPRISSPLVFDQNGASTAVAFEIGNVGQIPATNVMPHAWLGVLKSSGPSPVEEQQRRCDEIRQQPPGIGFTLFPGENFPENIRVSRWSLGLNISKEEIEKGLRVSADGKHIALFIVGCIDYTFATDPNHHHQTGFILDLRKNGPFLISPEERQISADDLILTEFGVGGGRRAD